MWGNYDTTDNRYMLVCYKFCTDELSVSWSMHFVEMPLAMTALAEETDATEAFCKAQGVGMLSYMVW